MDKIIAPANFATFTSVTSYYDMYNNLCLTINDLSNIQDSLSADMGWNVYYG
jgi:hypothetical protein